LRRSRAFLLALALIAAPATGALPARAPQPPPEVADIAVGLLVDLSSGRTLYDKQAAKRFPPASMAKVMTLFVAFEEMAKGSLSAGRKFTVAEKTARQWNGRGTSLYLRSHQEVDTDTLLRGIATASANDASVVLAEELSGDLDRWCALMNAHARRIGMTASHFATPSGWPDGGATYVTARDMVRLGEALIVRHPELYRRYVGQKRMAWQGVTLQSHDPTVGVVAGADGIKTGHTNDAGYNFLGSAIRDGRRLIVVIGGARSEAQRAAASRALLEWGFSEWRVRPLFDPGQSVGEARVQDGDALLVPLVADRTIAATMPKDAAEPITLRLVYDGPLIAPIAKGAQVAALEIRIGDGPPSRMPLFAAKTIGKAGPLDRIVNGFTRFFS
jgi:serine-type D-Ala-D-Ala carboxypeptidase (penicillin-binding protein 5/6)